MFLVSDTLEQRQARIRSLFTKHEMTAAVLLAAADFEWTVRRGILLLGKSPRREIRISVLAKCFGLDSYRDAWASEVGLTRKTLPRVINGWGYFRTQAFPLRNKIIHGIQGTTGLKYATERAESILEASRDVVNYCAGEGADIYRRLGRR
jgi:hypothetical protein